MICAIMQPTYIPWVGYFDLIDKVDKFVFYNDVQLTKRSWQVRNRIKGANGEIWLTIPISKTKSRNDTLIHKAMPNYTERWGKNHLKTIGFSYKKAPFFNQVFKFLEEMYDENNSLGGFNSNIITSISKRVGIKTEFINSSDIQGITGQKDERLVQLCKALSIDTYLSPQGSAEYINKRTKGGMFVTKNIELFYHNYQHPVYNQLYKEFVSHMGIYDLLFNEGFDNSLEIIRKGRKNNIYYSDL